MAPLHTRIITITAILIVGLLTIAYILQTSRSDVTRPPWEDSKSEDVLADIPTPNATKSDRPMLSFKDQSYRRVLNACKKRIKLCELKLSKSADVYVGHIRRNAGSDDPGLEGEVEQGKPLCNALSDLAKQDDVKLILEIGTGKGGGSTLCVATALAEQKGKLLYTLESNEANWDQSRRALKAFPVRCVLGSTVGPNDYFTPDSIPPSFKDEQYASYYKAEVERAAYLEPMLKPMCEAHDFDVIIHDGGDYSTEAEWRIIAEICRPKYFVYRGKPGVSYRAKLIGDVITSSCYKAIKTGHDPHLSGDIPWGVYKCQ